MKTTYSQVKRVQIMSMSGTENPLEHFIEDIGLFFEDMGLGRTPGRIIGALMVNDPPYMNMTELVDTTSMSKGSISNGLNLLTSVGFVEKFSMPSERPDFYKIDNDFWAKALLTKMTAIKGFEQSIGEAISIIKSKPDDLYPKRTKTLEEMRAMYQFFEQKMPLLLEEWEEIREERFE